MAKPEAKTDNLVRDLLKAANIVFDEQGSDIVEIDKALKTASKKGTGEIGFPEFVAVVKDFILVFEDKPTVDKHVKFVAENSTAISTDTDDIQAYAVNGAAFYGKHLIKNTTYKKCFAFGCSGNGNRLLITPMFIDDSLEPMVLENVETLSLFNDENIEDTYARDVLHEQTREQKELAQLLRDAEELHEDLRTYASLQDKDKPIVVSGILLALREPTFNVDSLIGDKQKTDGEIIYEAISAQLDRVDVSPQKKKDKVLGQFRIIKYSEPLNTFNNLLHKTPLKHYVEFLRDKVYHHVSNVSSSEDVLGRFYGEFMSYSGGDGQSLGIILTPKHITELFCELVDLTPDDTVLDPCCGTAGFLIAAMRDMLVKAGNEKKEEHIRKHQLHGVELQEYMYTIATTNMILRGDGKSNLMNADFLKTPAPDLQQKGATVGMINPPYSLAKKTKNKDLYEICFIKHLLDSLVAGGRCIAIVPQSTMAGTSKDEQAVKSSILAKHTLEGVVSLNPETFYGVGTIPCIAVFTAGKPHPENKRVKFIDFKDDGYKTQAHVGFIPTKRAPSRKQYLLDVWRDNLDADNDFCIKTTVKDTDEWLHSFYYFNDALPAEEDFAKTIGDYLTFEFSMVMRNKQDLFKTSPDEEEDGANE